MKRAPEHFEISVNEPFEFVGPNGKRQFRVVLRGTVSSFGESASHGNLLLEVTTPFQLEGDAVEFVVAAPRYEGVTLSDLITKGGTVGVARVRPGVSLRDGGHFGAKDTHYCIIGEIKPMADSHAV